MSDGPSDEQVAASEVVAHLVDGTCGVWKARAEHLPALKTVLIAVHTGDGTFVHYTGCFCPECAGQLRSALEAALVNAIRPRGPRH